MISLLCLATSQDPYRLLTLLREEPDIFDSLWMLAIPVASEAEDDEVTASEDTSSDIDAILRGEKR